MVVLILPILFYISIHKILPGAICPERHLNFTLVLTNYLTNAAKYGKEHGQATLTVVEDQGAMTVSVWNEGAGFTAEEKALLFSKFSRLKNENTANKRGSGLGLFLVKYILELHEGSVWAESEPGQWAKFCFRLPVNP